MSASTRRTTIALLASAAFMLAGCQFAAPRRAAPNSSAQPTIVFMTDFGTANDAVAICKAVIVGIAPDARIMDITHQVTPFSIADSSRFLFGVAPYYPAGTVFLVVVDPGVGTTRKALIAKSKKGQYFVAPDNGLLTPLMDRDGFDGAHEITNVQWMIGDNVSSTFHGRDIFSPAAAHLAEGWDWTQAGPPVTELVRFEAPIATIDEKGAAAEVVALDDPYGNLITNIQGNDFKTKLGYAFGDEVPITIGGKPYRFPFEKTFAMVPNGQTLVYIDSRGRVAIAVNQGDASKKYGVAPPVAVSIPAKRR